MLPSSLLTSLLNVPRLFEEIKKFVASHVAQRNNYMDVYLIFGNFYLEDMDLKQWNHNFIAFSQLGKKNLTKP